MGGILFRGRWAHLLPRGVRDQLEPAGGSRDRGKRAITIMQEIAGRRVPWEDLAKLLGGPGRRRMVGDRAWMMRRQRRASVGDQSGHDKAFDRNAVRAGHGENALAPNPRARPRRIVCGRQGSHTAGAMTYL